MAPATGAKNSQPGKIGLTPIRRAQWHVGSSEFASVRLRRLRACAAQAGAREAGVDGGEDLLGDGRFGERQQQASSRVEAERWVSGSKRRMDSISSPKNSTRTGRSISGE